MKSATIALLFAGVNAIKYVPENSKLINGDKGTYYTVPAGWSGQQIPGREFERPDTGLDDETVLRKQQAARFNAQGGEYVPEVASINPDKPLYYTVPGSWKGQQIPGQQFERPDTGLDDDAVLKKRPQSLNQYVPANAKLIHGDQGTYYTVPAGWSGQQIPGREFERPDTGLDDDTVLRKNQEKLYRLNAGRYVPENAKLIHGDRPLYYTAPAGWSGQQIPGREFERPDTGLDDDSVLQKKQHRNQQHNLQQNLANQKHKYVPEVSKLINGDKGTYYTVPAGWSGQQIPGREFERPDTGLDDETVLKKKQQKKRNADDF